mgnify:CR=1 FL=1
MGKVSTRFKVTGFQNILTLGAVGLDTVCSRNGSTDAGSQLIHASLDARHRHVQAG